MQTLSRLARATVRPFAPEDYPALCRVSNAVDPNNNDTPEEWRWRDAHRPAHCRWGRWVAVNGGEVVGFTTFYQPSDMYHPRKFYFGVDVHPEHQGAGIGSALYNRMMDAVQAMDPISVGSQAREDRERGVRFLERRGFEEVMRDWESRLDVNVFDFGPFEDAEARVLAQGIEIKSYAELASDPDRDRKLYDLDCDVTRDMPSTEPFTEPGFEHYRTAYLGAPHFLPDAWQIAVVNGEYVGLSCLWSSQGSDDLYNGATGVRRAWRRRGIALALKVRNIRWARANGRPRIRTWNETGNRAMLSINEALGFVKEPVWIGYRKTLRPE